MDVQEEHMLGKQWREYIYKLMAAGGSDTVHKAFLNSDEDGRTTFIAITEEVIAEMQGMLEVMVMTDTDADQMIKGLKEKSKEI